MIGNAVQILIQRLVFIFNPLIPVLGLSLLAHKNTILGPISFVEIMSFTAILYPLFSNKTLQFLDNIKIKTQPEKKFSNQYLVSSNKILISACILSFLFYLAPDYMFLAIFFLLRFLTLVTISKPNLFDSLNELLTNCAALFFIILIMISEITEYSIAINIVAFLIFRKAASESEIKFSDITIFLSGNKDSEVKLKGLDPSITENILASIFPTPITTNQRKNNKFNVLQNFNDFFAVLELKKQNKNVWSFVSHKNLNFSLDIPSKNDFLLLETKADDTAVYNINSYSCDIDYTLLSPNHTSFEILSNAQNLNNNFRAVEKSLEAEKEVKSKIDRYLLLCKKLPPVNENYSTIQKFNKIIPELLDEYFDQPWYELPKDINCCAILKAKGKIGLVANANFIACPIGSYFSLDNIIFLKKIIENQYRDKEREDLFIFLRKSINNFMLHLVLNHYGSLPYNRIDKVIEILKAEFIVEVTDTKIKIPNRFYQKS